MSSTENTDSDVNYILVVISDCLDPCALATGWQSMNLGILASPEEDKPRKDSSPGVTKCMNHVIANEMHGCHPVELDFR